MLIPNTNYKIDRNIKRIFLNDKIIKPIDGVYNITVNDELVLNKDYLWLERLTILNLVLPNDFHYALEYLDFHEHTPYGVSKDVNFIPIFRKPIYYDKIYRIIARYPSYAVSNTGIVKNINSGAIIKCEDVKVFKYNRHRLLDPITNKHRIPATHRLVAMCWCTNTDYKNKNVIEHKDNNKNNNYYKNLHWVTNRHNVHKARVNNQGYLVRNIETSVISYFKTIGEVSNFIGRSSKIDVSRTPLHNQRIWKGNSGIFEIQYKTLNNIWVYDKITSTKVIYELSTSTGKIYFSSIYKLLKHLKLPANTTLLDIILYLEQKLPGTKINTIIGNGTMREREVKNIITGDIYSSAKMKDLIKITGIPKSTMVKYLDLGWDDRIINNWLMRYKSTLPWSDELGLAYSYNPSNKKIVFTSDNGEIIRFTSISHASKALKIAQRTVVKKIIKNKKIFYNNKIGYLSEY